MHNIMEASEFSGKLPMEIGESGLGVHHEDVVDGDCGAKSSQIDGSCIKRTRQVDDDQTSVQIIFKLLSRKSKKKLAELLQQWSEWHAQECFPSEGSDEDFESGDETYFPSLNVSMEKSYSISVYVDNQVKKKQKTDDSLFNKDCVPIYDRGFEFALTPGDGMADNGSVLDILNASRCFNCDAYDHSLKDCPKPFNKSAVDKARKLHQLKSKRPAGPRVLIRYYQDTPGGKFDGLKPGCLDSETRKLLGLGEFDAPPWLNRMREMGYPPGYLDLEEEDQPSGIVIYDNEDRNEENKKCLDVNCTEPKRKMSVDFPGINAPMPINADRSQWGAPNFQATGFNSCGNKSPLSHSHTPYTLPDYRRDWSPFISEYACNNRSYELGFPLLSKYANEYWDHINQPSAPYSSYAYQNSWSSFDG